MMSSCLAMPRKGHLDTLFHAFTYQKKNHNAEMVFDPTEPEVDMMDFLREDWSYSIYGDAKEELPPIKPFAESGPGDMPEPRGIGFTMTVYVDYNLGGDCVTRWSRTGYTVFLNGPPIYWFSKKQASCEVNIFGSEFTAMKQDIEYVRGFCYKLRMMGIACEEPVCIMH